MEIEPEPFVLWRRFTYNTTQTFPRVSELFPALYTVLIAVICLCSSSEVGNTKGVKTRKSNTKYVDLSE